MNIHAKPYIDYSVDGGFIREFPPDCDPLDLIWHQDKKTRKVTVLNDSDWKFQFDNQLPIPLNQHTVINIPKEEYHRIHKGTTKLIIMIEEI